MSTMLMLFTAVATIDYAATKWTAVAFRPNEPLHLACQLAGQDGFSRYLCIQLSSLIITQSVGVSYKVGQSYLVFGV